MHTRSDTPRTDGGRAVENLATRQSGDAAAAARPDEPGYGTGLAAGTGVDRWLAGGLVALAVALAVNTLLGPAVLDVVTYPFSETLVNQTIGLELVSLLLVAPWAIAAAVLLRRGHRAGPTMAIPPAAYTAYMFVQYVLGPQYLVYRPVVLFHLAVFVLSGALLVAAWARVSAEALPALSRRRERRLAVGLLGLAAFVVFRYVPSLAGMASEADLSAEFALDPTMFWSIFFLDLGVVVPVTVAAAVGLFKGADWARKAAYAVVGWFVLVPVSVAAMGATMVVNDDPHAAAGMVAVFAVGAVLFTAFAVWVFRPLFGRDVGARADSA